MYKNKWITILMASLLALSLCNISCDKVDEEGFTSFNYNITGSGYIINVINNSKSSLKMAVRVINDNAVIEALNNASIRGVDVDIVLDAESTITGLATDIEVISGNSSGNMDSNMVISDNVSVTFLSTSDFSRFDILYITITGIYMLDMVNTEFNQMFTLQRFGLGVGPFKENAKQQLNYITDFFAGRNELHMYMVPQNMVISDKASYLLAQIYQAKYSLYVAAQYINNDLLSRSFLDAKYGGIATTIVIGQEQNTITTSFDDTEVRNSDSTTVVAGNLGYNLIFIDVGTNQRRMIFTTFPLNSNGTIEVSDGICLILNGPSVDDLHSEVVSRVSVK